MHVAKRDIIATSLVGVAGALYLLWLADAVPSALTDVRAIGLAILALGFAASATAVVPSFDQLVHGNRVYAATTSLLGLVALAAGVVMLASSSEAALAVLMGTMVVLWGISTVHHTQLGRPASGPVWHAVLTR